MKSISRGAQTGKRTTRSGSANMGPLYVAKQTSLSNEIKSAKCAKCGKEIPVGQEVKKGFLKKKSYHKECAG
ncbi:MAG: hypothetical protein ACLQEQ_08745 [Nitrososphaerales archaeon]